MNQFSNEPPSYQQHNNFGGGMQQHLPNATIVLVLGIVSIVLCFCCGLFGVISGIIGIVMANKDRRLLQTNPGAYTDSSIKNLNAGRICAIIGTILSSLYLLFSIIWFAFYGTILHSNQAFFVQ